MKKGVVLFIIVLVVGVLLAAVITKKSDALSDIPAVTPNRTQIIPPGTSTSDVVQTNDEGRIGELLMPTPTVKKATNKLLGISCAQGTDLCKLQAIYDFVRLNYEYNEHSPQHNYIQSPSETLYYGSGDALDLALLISSMGRAAGFENEILRTPYHTFVRTWNGNQTIMMEPACQGCRFLDLRVTLRGDEKVYK